MSSLFGRSNEGGARSGRGVLLANGRSSSSNQWDASGRLLAPREATGRRLGRWDALGPSMDIWDERDASRDAARDGSRDGSRDASRDASRDVARDTSRDGSREAEVPAAPEPRVAPKAAPFDEAEEDEFIEALGLVESGIGVPPEFTDEEVAEEAVEEEQVLEEGQGEDDEEEYGDSPEKNLPTRLQQEPDVLSHALSRTLR